MMAGMAARLIGLSVSAWTEKARWALDHHRLEYTYEQYVPMLGAPLLRLQMKRLTGKVTVPVLFTDDGQVFGDSLAIAHYADSIGTRLPLFNSHQVDEWNAKSEAALVAARGLGMKKMAVSEGAKREQVPAFIPDGLRAAALPAASLGVSYIVRKYGLDREPAASFEAALRDILLGLRAGLRGKDYLLGDFSYADITMAVALQFVKPVSVQYMNVAPFTRECFTQPALAEEFADLVQWRDALYVSQRHPVS
jgi:glutathione S-transferase